MEVEELQKLALVIQTVGSLPLLRDFVARMGFADIIAPPCPLAAQAAASGGTVAALLVANRLQAPQPWSKGEPWAREVGVQDVFRLPPELLTDERLGRMVARLGQHAPVLQGEIALPIAQTCQMGWEQIHGDRTPVSLAGAYEEEEDAAPTEREGGPLT